jgi:hypothetical protein
MATQYIYRYNGIKIHDGWEDPVTGIEYTKASWFDSQTTDKLEALGVTRHEKPAVPSYDSYYQKPVEQDDGTYLIEDKPLEDVRRRKKDEINAERDQRETAGFLYQGKLFDSDQRSADRIQVAALAAQAAINAGETFSVTWTVSDNTDVVLDAAGVLGMVAAFAEHGESIFETAKALKADVDACKNGKAVKDVEWP